MSISISVILSNVSRLFGGDLGAVVEAARVADAVGIHQIAVPDHVAVGERTDLYPGGKWRYPVEEPWGEPLTLLAAIAQATSHVRLGTSVLLAPLRPALFLAKQVATLDVLSGGRLDLGIGSGWHAEEFEASGVPFANRGSRMNDALGACRALWRDSPAEFASKTVSFLGLRSHPQPVQPGGIPIWVGGEANPRNVARITEYGVGWMPILTGSSPELPVGIQRIHESFRAAGRDPAELQVRAGLDPVFDADRALDLEASLAGLPALAERGVTLASVGLEGFVRRAEDVRGFIERVGEATRELR